VRYKIRCDWSVGTPTITALTLTEGAADDEYEIADRKAQTTDPTTIE
jgi:hypothetical protein